MTPQSLDMIKALVGFDTVSRHSNLELIEFVHDYLARLNVPARIIPSPDGAKANLIATLGPDVEGGVVLSGHTDVVPVDGQPWDTDPFTVMQSRNRLYGRGTCDMKSFLAIALAMTPQLQAKGLKRPIHLAMSYDEEVGCFGAPSMIARLLSDIAPPLGVFVGEPTNMRPVVAHKSIAALRTTISGHEAHSSQIDRGVSAVMTAARLITFIDDMMAQNRAAAASGSRFDPPYTTLHVGTVRGGTAVNIIARECEFIWDIRALPNEDWRAYLERFNAYADSLLPAMRAIAPQASIVTDVLASVPPLREHDGPAHRLASQLTGVDDLGVASYVSEAGQFQEQGFSVVLCGPGSMDQAHQPNEYIEIAQVTACERFLDRLGDHLSH